MPLEHEVVLPPVVWRRATLEALLGEVRRYGAGLGLKPVPAPVSEWLGHPGGAAVRVELLPASRGFVVPSWRCVCILTFSDGSGLEFTAGLELDASCLDLFADGLEDFLGQAAVPVE